MKEWAEKLKIPPSRLYDINRILADAGTPVIKEFFDVIRKYGTIEEINAKADVIEKGLWNVLQRNYLDKHDAVNHTARALTERGLSVIPAWKLHEGVPGR